MRRKRRSRGQSQGEAAEGTADAAQEESRSERRKAQLAQWRDKFIQNVQSAGLLMEKVQLLGYFSTMYGTMLFLMIFSLPQEESSSVKKTIHYLKLHAPWDVLVYYAEELCLRAPLQVRAMFSCPSPQRKYRGFKITLD